MFVVSVKTNRKKAYGLAALLLLLILILAAVFFGGDGGEAAMAEAKYSLQAETNQERIGFLKQFGWEVNPEPEEIAEITIPQNFNQVYEKYNEIQKGQNMDLSPYAGKICKKWVYQVENYPDKTQTVHATLLVYKGKVIGGDISSAALDGFMVGFLGEGTGQEAQEPPSQTAPESSAEEEPAPTESATVSEIPTAAWPTD